MCNNSCSGCSGNGSFDYWWIIILIVLIWICCCGGSFFGCGGNGSCECNSPCDCC